MRVVRELQPTLNYKRRWADLILVRRGRIESRSQQTLLSGRPAATPRPYPPPRRGEGIICARREMLMYCRAKSNLGKEDHVYAHKNVNVLPGQEGF
jgi:hypothetical protein